MKTTTIALWLILLCALLVASCKTLVFGSSDYEDVNESRAMEQVHFEDSAKVFFTSCTNPYPDKEFLWFAVFTKGVVEMRVHDLESDSLQSVYHFIKQETPVHTIALHNDRMHLVKCILFVDGRMKCAKVYPAWNPIQIPQFKTQYTISNK